MSNTPIKDQLDGILANIGTVNEQGVKGLYFRNLNRDRPVRIVASRPSAVSASTDVENNNTTIEQIDSNTVGFCLSPRAPLNIQCVGATSAVALEMKPGKKYKVVLNGVTISIDSDVTQIRELLSMYNLVVDYVIAPREYYCTEYRTDNSVTVAFDTVDTNKPLLFILTTDDGVVYQQNINTGSSLFNLDNLGTIFITRELVAIDSKIVMNFDLSQLTNLVDRNFKVEVKPLTTDFSAVNLSDINVPEGQTIPFDNKLSNTIVFNRSAYSCLLLGDPNAN